MRSSPTRPDLGHRRAHLRQRGLRLLPNRPRIRSAWRSTRPGSTAASQEAGSDTPGSKPMTPADSARRARSKPQRRWRHDVPLSIAATNAATTPERCLRQGGRARNVAFHKFCQLTQLLNLIVSLT
jgi:hypothetical protein